MFRQLLWFEWNNKPIIRIHFIKNHVWGHVIQPWLSKYLVYEKHIFSLKNNMALHKVSSSWQTVFVTKTSSFSNQGYLNLHEVIRHGRYDFENRIWNGVPWPLTRKQPCQHVTHAATPIHRYRFASFFKFESFLIQIYERSLNLSVRPNYCSRKLEN